MFESQERHGGSQQSVTTSSDICGHPTYLHDIYHIDMIHGIHAGKIFVLITFLVSLMSNMMIIKI